MEAASSTDSSSDSSSDNRSVSSSSSSDSGSSQEEVSSKPRIAERTSPEAASSDESSKEDNHSDSGDTDGEQRRLEESLPIAERVKHAKEKGMVGLQSRRKRRREAVQVASQRLTEFKRKQKKKSDDSDDSSGEESLSNKDLPKKKRSKHAPTEASSTRQAFYSQHRHKTLNESGIGVEIGANRYQARDPRLDSLSAGKLNVDHFEHHYKFVQDIRDQEMATLKRRIQASKLSGKKGQKLRHKLGMSHEGYDIDHDKQELKRLQIEKAEMERQQIDRHAKRQVKKKLQENVATGQASARYFPKRNELKKLHLEAKYEELRTRGGDRAIQKVVAKRRKKNKSRDANMLGGRNANA